MQFRHDYRLRLTRHKLREVGVRASILLLLALLSGCSGCIDTPARNYIVDEFNAQTRLPSGWGASKGKGQQGGENSGQEPGNNGQSGNPNGPSGSGGTGGALPVSPGDPGEEPFDDELDGEPKLLPNYGSVDGGNHVRLVGTLVDDKTKVYLGNKLCEVVERGGELVFVAPPGQQGGVVSLKVVKGDATSTLVENAYNYIAPIKIEQVTPNRIDAKGGSVVEIIGSYFPQDLGFYFGQEKAIHVERVSDERLRVVAPKHARGTASVRIVSPYQSVEKEDAVRFVSRLESVEFSKSFGRSTGGEVVDLKVDRLASDASLPDQGVAVSFDGKPATIVSVDSATGIVRVTTPSVKSSAVLPHAPVISVETVDDRADFTDVFLYIDTTQATILSLSQTVGDVLGGDEVTILGANLATVDSVTLGGVNATIVSSDDSSVTIKTPPHAVGLVDLTLSASGVVVANQSNAYEYIELPTMDAISPVSGPTAGGTSVTITGQHLDRVSSILLGDVDTQIVSQTSTKIEIVTLNHRVGEVDLLLRSGDVVRPYHDVFRYVASLGVWRAIPERGSRSGGNRVMVRGEGFGEKGQTSVKVKFGETQVDAVVVSDNELQVITPAHRDATVDLGVVRGAESTSKKEAYTFYDPVRPFGGMHGDPIGQNLNISVVSSAGERLEGATVFVTSGSKLTHQLSTNELGEAILNGADLSSSVTVSAAKEGYSIGTIVDVTTENVTILLHKMEPPPPTAGSGSGQTYAWGRIRGRLSAPGKGAYGDSLLEANYGYVVSTVQPGGLKFEPGEGSYVSPLPGSFELYTHSGQQALVAFCGYYDAARRHFTPMLMGIVRNVEVNDGDILDIDVACDRPLSESFRAKFTNDIYLPGGPTFNLLRVTWDLGKEGVVESPYLVKGNHSLMDVKRLPPLDPEVEDIRLQMKGGSYSDDGRAMTYTSYDLLLKEALDSANLNRLVMMPPLLDLPRPLYPHAGDRLTNILQFNKQPTVAPDFWSILIQDSDGGTFLHQIILPGNATTYYVVPELLRQVATFGVPVPSKISITVMGGRRTVSLPYRLWNYTYLSPRELRQVSKNEWSLQLSLN